jgi:flagellar hook capping protein FlgD
VDNIPPSPPAPFTGAYSAGATYLHWGANSEADLAGYRLYRGASAGFVPSPANRIGDQPDTGFVDAGPAGSYYKLSAVDIHGNESAFALLTPSGTSDAPPAAPHALAFAAPSPDPAPGAVRLAFELPARAHVSLAVFDAAGRRVRTLVSGALDAGAHALAWRGDDDGGRALGGGVYFATLETRGHRLTRRVALLR